MNTNEKIARVKTLLGDNSISNDKIAVYLDLAKSEIMNRLYQLYDETPNEEIPVKYENKQCSLAVVMYNTDSSGGIGLASHSESAMGTSVTDYYVGGNAFGMSRWYSYLTDITPYARKYSRR